MRSLLSAAMFSSRKTTGALSLLAAAVLFASLTMAAQQPQAGANSTSAATARKSPRHRAKPVEPPPAAEQVTAEQASPAPPEPEPPKWPVNETASKPSVTWDSQGLRIQANNASLHEILNQVSTDTGTKVEGIGADERIFGEYGPGNARDVLSQLLHGSSYNVLMIGDQGAGTPRQIVLSARRAGNNNNQQQANRSVPQEQPDEDIPDQPEADDQQQFQPPMINGRPPMQMPPQGPQGPPGAQGAPPGTEGPPGAPRTPQQVLQELQMRQQQIQDQMQQQQQQQPH